MADTVDYSSTAVNKVITNLTECNTRVDSLLNKMEEIVGHAFGAWSGNAADKILGDVGGAVKNADAVSTQVRTIADRMQSMDANYVTAESGNKEMTDSIMNAFS